MYIALFRRHHLIDYEEFRLQSRANHYLKREEERGELYPICIYVSDSKEIVWRNQWPNGRDMTDEEIRPALDAIEDLRNRQATQEG